MEQLYNPNFTMYPHCPECGEQWFIEWNDEQAMPEDFDILWFSYECHCMNCDNRFHYSAKFKLVESEVN